MTENFWISWFDRKSVCIPPMQASWQDYRYQVHSADSLINLDTPVEFQAFVLTGYLISYLSEAYTVGRIITKG